MHILSAYIFHVGHDHQLYDPACWCRMSGLHAGAGVKFLQVELDS